MLKFDNTQFAIVTAINKDNKKKFNQQVNRIDRGLEILWKDVNKGKTKKTGGLFCFSHYGDAVEICLVNEIIKPDNEKWNSIEDNINKNVLSISKFITTINWKEWISIGGHKTTPGTSIIKKNHTLFMDGIQKYLVKLPQNREIRHKIEGERNKFRYQHGTYNARTETINMIGKRKSFRFIEFAKLHLKGLEKSLEDFKIVDFSENDFEVLKKRTGRVEVWVHVTNL